MDAWVRAAREHNCIRIRRSAGGPTWLRGTLTTLAGSLHTHSWMVFYTGIIVLIAERSGQFCAFRWPADV